jgi:hypothetical protein
VEPLQGGRGSLDLLEKGGVWQAEHGAQRGGTQAGPAWPAKDVRVAFWLHCQNRWLRCEVICSIYLEGGWTAEGIRRAEVAWEAVNRVTARCAEQEGQVGGGGHGSHCQADELEVGCGRDMKAGPSGKSGKAERRWIPTKSCGDHAGSCASSLCSNGGPQGDGGWQRTLGPVIHEPVFRAIGRNIKKRR